MMTTSYHLVWFRSDLRVHDNPALHAAMNQGPTVAVYLLCAQQWQEHGIAPAKRSLILRQLRSLAQQLEQLRVPLLIVDCGSFSKAASGLLGLAQKLVAQRLYFNHEYEVNEHRCADEVQLSLAKIGVPCATFHDSCLVEPGKIRTQQGGCYQVFTAFKKALIKDFDALARPMVGRPIAQTALKISSDLCALNQYEADQAQLHERWQPLWPAGENEALSRLERFVATQVQHYAQQRDLPAVSGTSQLSPYLTAGAISTTQCLQAVRNQNQGQIDGGNPGVATWLNELIWREFYRHLLQAYPDLCRFKAYKADTDRLPWQHDEALFRAWTSGQTGYPIVDAAMQQLLQTGWMHNRLRMISAMFLTKNLFIDWRWGEAFFMAHLVDGDLASNNGGWQWSASTGVDAVPYFRIFNPLRQSQRFDPAGDFIRHYLPALSTLDSKSIHQPSAAQAQALNYPLPIVDYATSVAQTKYWFKQLSGSKDTVRSTIEE